MRAPETRAAMWPGSPPRRTRRQRNSAETMRRPIMGARERATVSTSGSSGTVSGYPVPDWRTALLLSLLPLFLFAPALLPGGLAFLARAFFARGGSRGGPLAANDRPLWTGAAARARVIARGHGRF